MKRKKKKRKQRVWRHMSYGDAVQLVQDALQTFVNVNELEGAISNDPDHIDVALWNWSRLFVWSWRSPARISALNLRTTGKED